MKKNISTGAIAAILLTGPALWAGCVEMSGPPDDGPALEVAAGGVAASVDPRATDDPDAVADPGFAGEAGAMLVRELAGEAGGPRSLTAALPVTLYKDNHYSGSRQSLSAGLYDMDQLTIGNDELSSLRVPAGTTVKLYQNQLWGGSSLVLTSDIAKLGDRGFNDKTSSIAVHGVVSEPPGVPYSLGTVTDVEDLEYRVASDATVTARLAYFADMLGFGWCGGTQSPYVGDNFDVLKNSDGSYSMNAHYNANDPYSGGHRASERLKIKISNFRIAIDPATFVYGQPTLTSMTPIALVTGTARNASSTASTIAMVFSSAHTDTYAHETNVTFTEGAKVAIKNTARIPFFGAENAARLQAMEAARHHIDDKLRALRDEANRMRQDEITSELLDVIIGAQAVRG